MIDLVVSPHSPQDALVLSWIDTAPCGCYYIFRSRSQQGPFFNLSKVRFEDATRRTYTDNTSHENITYFYQVVNNLGDRSNIASQHFPQYYADNGFDPILGPPYPPVNYDMKVHDGQNGDFLQPRLTWTAPDVMIDLTPEGGLDFSVRINSYDLAPTIASLDDIVVTLSGGSRRFIDTATDAGWRIIWDTGDIATVVIVQSETQAVMDISGSIDGNLFAAVFLPPNTVFELWKFDGAMFNKLYDSNTTSTIGWLGETLMQFFVPQTEAGTYYVRAVSGARAVYSANFTYP